MPLQHNYKLTLAYEGTLYYGWQKTPEGPSVEETLEKALEELLQHPITLQAASRTDRGVHAEHQVVNFFSPTILSSDFLPYLNKTLPIDISVTTLKKASLSFHPTLDASGKEYHYTLRNHIAQEPFYRHFSWHIPHKLSLKHMHEAASHFLGTHDFSSFTNTRFPKHENTHCTLSAIEISEIDNHRIRIHVFGDHFLYKMVRNLVGTIAYVGLGKIDSTSIPALIQNRDRKHLGITAPPEGLCLANIFYQ